MSVSRMISLLTLAGLLAGASRAAAQEGLPSELSDAEVAHVAVTANTIDIALGHLAQERAGHESVRSFARLMVSDHGAANQQAIDLAKKLDVTVEDNAVSQALTQEFERVRDNLAGLRGAQFDRAYMSREVGFHQNVLETLDDLLIPTTSNQELKQLLNDVRGVIARHLEHARQVRSELGESN